MKNEGKIAKYLHDSFGWNVRFEDFPEIRKKMPYAILGSAEFELMELEGIKTVAIEPIAASDLRMNKNIFRAVEKKLQMSAVLILEDIDTHQRRSLIECHISFIIPNKQLYLPSIGAFFNERGLGYKSNMSQELSTVATALLILQLSEGSLQGKSVTEAAKMMGYSIKTLSLAINELERQEFLSVKLNGRKKLLDFKLTPKDLWKKAYPLMKNPVEKKLFTTDASLAKEIGVKASDTALSEISMLTAPNQEVYAVYARDRRLMDLPLNSNDGTIMIEIWKTDPHITSKEGVADIFSLALTFRDDDDPRIKKEINNIINERL